MHDDDVLCSEAARKLEGLLQPLPDTQVGEDPPRLVDDDDPLRGAPVRLGLDLRLQPCGCAGHQDSERRRVRVQHRPEVEDHKWCVEIEARSGGAAVCPVPWHSGRESEGESKSMVVKLTAWRCFIPVLVLGGGLVTFFALGLERYLSLDTLRQYRGDLRVWVETSGILVALIFMAVYIVTVALSLPGATVLSIASGFLFGTIWGTVIVVVSATLGSTVLFVIAKTTVGDVLRARTGTWLHRLEAGFREHALSYLLVLRLVPVFPFFVINLVPAFLGVSLSIFVLGTFVGIIPGSFVYTSVGAGLGSIFDAGGTCHITGVLTPQIVMALMGLAVLALVPVVYKKILAPRGERATAPRSPVS